MWWLVGKRLVCELSWPLQELAQVIPDIGSSRIQEMPAYNGGRDTTRIMVATRGKLEQIESTYQASGKYSTASSYTAFEGTGTYSRM